jgi:hypothetical protein
MADPTNLFTWKLTDKNGAVYTEFDKDNNEVPFSSIPREDIVSGEFVGPLNFGYDSNGVFRINGVGIFLLLKLANVESDPKIKLTRDNGDLIVYKEGSACLDLGTGIVKGQQVADSYNIGYKWKDSNLSVKLIAKADCYKGTIELLCRIVVFGNSEYNGSQYNDPTINGTVTVGSTLSSFKDFDVSFELDKATEFVIQLADSK